MSRALAGVDGCRAGWIAAIAIAGEAPFLRVFPRFETLLDSLPSDAAIAVDMPIGLPERIVGPGRVAEAAARPCLAGRQSSVFSIPARAAVEADPGPHEDDIARSAAHARANAIARTLSDPPRGVSRQGFMLFPKILEIDRLLRARPGLADRLIESHPELAFCQLNGGIPLSLPKKMKSRPHPPGLLERRTLLLAHALPAELLSAALPAKTGEDDRLDACAMLLVAGRHARGETLSFPDPPGRDAHGLPIAIRV
ncbi:hypothetical protein GCM10011390_27000 [Aureimonas endophytica]|uniref:RNase H-like nuclease n=1 Tax=Aureimonas endophytica TaxID=2027858 RepID=A0A916ZNR1_9HYPH|nr:DUF429 domain-containing protein [Aureimonas endophytica]GGE06491.1 hypothetical protein GCM10011390_27000 [Aureimonas endophytica]